MIAMEEVGQNSLFEIIIHRCTQFCSQTFDEYFDDKIALDYLAYKYASTSAMLLKNGCIQACKRVRNFQRRFI